MIGLSLQLKTSLLSTQATMKVPLIVSCIASEDSLISLVYTSLIKGFPADCHILRLAFYISNNVRHIHHL